ncbi:hypothetical protein FNQ90_02435 [Streptomyces alkaliphilus]|uniref:Uncharacterized protein n=1 Tax=Streptomyces alkaliphilus TaxID=1472722 RepID=A0A7W3TA35_9ACTN|nr:hypothetical protein [Streptomyces alkaliphilus]MBB0242993.1 hypothetical protein [Streptomyces alkaliphilus]
MANRYSVTKSPWDSRQFVIFDRVMYGYCTLPDDATSDHPNLLPLEWSNEHAAEAWLQQCYQAWGSGRVPAPRGWQPLRYEPSPWAGKPLRGGSRDTEGL